MCFCHGYFRFSNFRSLGSATIGGSGYLNSILLFLNAGSAIEGKGVVGLGRGKGGEAHFLAWDLVLPTDP